MVGRRAVLPAAVMLCALVAVGGAALAETLAGNDGDNRLIGSNQRDSISGGGGDDLIKGLRSIDRLKGGGGGGENQPRPRGEEGAGYPLGPGGGGLLNRFYQ